MIPWADRIGNSAGNAQGFRFEPISDFDGRQKLTAESVSVKAISHPHMPGDPSAKNCFRKNRMN